MFRDARLQDRQRTASSFKQAYQRYLGSAEAFYDGSVGSLDHRIAAANKLLHACEFTTARLDTTDAAPYLRAANKLKSDVRALQGLREAALNGAAYYEEADPPGFHTAHWAQDALASGHQFPTSGPDPQHYPDYKSWMNASNLHSYLQDSTSTFNGPGSEHTFTSPQSQQQFNQRFTGAYPANAYMRDMPHGGGQAMWDPEANDWAVQDVGSDMTHGDTYQTVPHSVGGQDPRDYSGTSDYPAAYQPGNPYHSGPAQYPEPGSENKPGTPGNRPAVTRGDPNFRSPQEGVSPDYVPPPGAQKLPPGQERNWPNPNVQQYHGKPPPQPRFANRAWDEVKHVMAPPPLEKGMVDPSEELYDPASYEHDMGGKHDDRPVHDQWGSDHDEVEHFASLQPQDKRWVTLEASKFAAANEDAWTTPKELAIRAHNHATVVTSTFDPRRSASVSRAFVANVVEVGRRSYRPPVRQLRASVDMEAIPPEAMFL